MESPAPRVGFLGFGEAGYHMGKGLAAGNLTGIVAHDKFSADPKTGALIRRRAADAGVTLVPSLREFCRRADLIVALVPGRAALRALRATLPHLTPAHLYVDAGTASVEAMEEAGRILDGKAGFVDAAMMGAVPLAGHQVAILASGSHAAAFQRALEPYGMNIRVVGERPGAATAMKLIRSVFMKGIAAVLLEALEAPTGTGSSRPRPKISPATWMNVRSGTTSGAWWAGRPSTPSGGPSRWPRSWPC